MSTSVGHADFFPSTSSMRIIRITDAETSATEWPTQVSLPRLVRYKQGNSCGAPNDLLDVWIETMNTIRTEHYGSFTSSSNISALLNTTTKSDPSILGTVPHPSITSISILDSGCSGT